MRDRRTIGLASTKVPIKEIAGSQIVNTGNGFVTTLMPPNDTDVIFP